MIYVKHLMDAPQDDDGTRIWVEPIGLTRDLCEWCKVDFQVAELGPPKVLAEWFERNPDGYDCFRELYRAVLFEHPNRAALRDLADLAVMHDITLLHQGDDPERNTATALLEFLGEARATAHPEL